MRVPSHGICALDTLSTMCTLLLAWTMALAVQAADPPRPMEEIDGDAYCFAPSSDASVQGDYLLADNPILHEGRIKAWTVKLKPFLASDPSIMDPSIPVIVRVYRPAHLDQDPRQAPTYRVVAEANLLREAVQQDGRFWERPEMTRTLHVDPPMDVRPGDVIGYQNVGVFGLHARPPFGPFTPYTWINHEHYQETESLERIQAHVVYKRLHGEWRGSDNDLRNPSLRLCGPRWMDLTAKMEVRELTMPPNALVQANDLRLVGATSTYYRGNVDSTCMNCDFIASAHRFTAHGRVKAWAAYIDTTYATTARPTILFRVYRPVRTSPGDDFPMTFQLIGQNRVQILPTSLSERRTFAQVDVPPHAQITVQPGDVLGWSYPDSSGIITYSYVNVDRQVMLVKARSGPDLRLEVGDVVPIRTLSALRTYSRREYSVQAVLETADDDHTLNTNGRDLFGVTDDGTKYSVFAAPEEDDVDSGDDDDDEAVVDPCAICLRSLSRGATKTTRNCRHTFHRGCLSRWEARSHSDCPLCRSRL